MLIRTGYPFYGQAIGILVFSTTTPRIPGDAGHGKTFSYPVHYQVVEGGFMDLIKGSPKIKDNILTACENMKKIGVRGIVGDCGLMSLYQDAIGEETGIPFVGSSLCQIPTVWQMIGRSGTIGVVTGHSKFLGMEHLKNSGWNADIKISVQGLQDEPHFAEIVIKGGLDLDISKMEEDVLSGIKKLMEKTPDLKAIIIECSNLATYSKKIGEFSKVPVFDTISAANMLSYAVDPPTYQSDF